MLDDFLALSFEFLTTRAIPPTSPSCRWSFASGRCEPSCECVFRFQPGDYSPSRSCRDRRVRPAEEEYSEEELEGEGGGDDGYDEPPEQGCEVPRTTRVARAAMGARRLSGEVGAKVKDVVGRRVGELH
ncbi:hypothetical protein TeGR_g1650, partial [Tetraparma gracilis]